MLAGYKICALFCGCKRRIDGLIRESHFIIFRADEFINFKKRILHDKIKVKAEIRSRNYDNLRPMYES